MLRVWEMTCFFAEMGNAMCFSFYLWFQVCQQQWGVKFKKSSSSRLSSGKNILLLWVLNLVHSVLHYYLFSTASSFSLSIIYKDLPILTAFCLTLFNLHCIFVIFFNKKHRWCLKSRTKMLLGGVKPQMTTNDTFYSTLFCSFSSLKIYLFPLHSVPDFYLLCLRL